MPKNFAEFDSSVVITAAFFSSRVRFIIVHCLIVQSPTCECVERVLSGVGVLPTLRKRPCASFLLVPCGHQA